MHHRICLWAKGSKYFNTFLVSKWIIIAWNSLLSHKIILLIVLFFFWCKVNEKQKRIIYLIYRTFQRQIRCPYALIGILSCMALDNLTGGVFPCSCLVDSSFQIKVSTFLCIGQIIFIFDLVNCSYGIVFTALRAVFASILCLTSLSSLATLRKDETSNWVAVQGPEHRSYDTYLLLNFLATYVYIKTLKMGHF